MKYIAKSVTVNELSYREKFIQVIQAIPHLAEMLTMVELKEGDADSDTAAVIINQEFITHCLAYIKNKHFAIPGAELRLATQLFMENSEMQCLVRVFLSYVQDGKNVDHVIMHGIYRGAPDWDESKVITNRLAENLHVQTEWAATAQDKNTPLTERKEELMRAVNALLDIRRAELHGMFGGRYSLTVRKEDDGRSLTFVIVLYDNKEMAFHTIKRLEAPYTA